MALTKITQNNRMRFESIDNEQPALGFDVNPIIDRVNALSSSDTALTVNTISEGTSGSGVTITGQRFATPTAITANTTLTAAQSGTLFLLNIATGAKVTLPAGVAGLRYEFLITTSVTSNTYDIWSAGATALYGGVLTSVVASTGVHTQYAPNGSSNYKISMNGTTTGGLQGTRIRITCVSATSWIVEGVNYASGTVATPFAG